ncbi:unnamed protein product [Amoebophrya sp. A25]|nr:unnamed protein product [Amoebophrya sp. A25]|eukprot:GSA25T00027914001.1
MSTDLQTIRRASTSCQAHQSINRFLRRCTIWVIVKQYLDQEDTLLPF